MRQPRFASTFIIQKTIAKPPKPSISPQTTKMWIFIDFGALQPPKVQRIPMLSNLKLWLHSTQTSNAAAVFPGGVHAVPSRSTDQRRLSRRVRFGTAQLSCEMWSSPWMYLRKKQRLQYRTFMLKIGKCPLIADDFPIWMEVFDRPDSTTRNSHSTAGADSSKRFIG